MLARSIALALIVMLSLGACERKPLAPPAPVIEELRLAPAEFADLPGWMDDSMAEALPALRRSCLRILRSDANASLGPRAIGGTPADWADACAAVSALAEHDDAALRRMLETHFAPLQVSAGDDAFGLFTGYYEAELDGARTPSQRFSVPLYRRPPDLISANLGSFADDLAGRTISGRVAGDRFVPYATRAEIENGALAGQGLELMWVDDAVEAFILQVQGSGRIRLAEGGATRLGFAAANGHPFFAIGRALIERGALSKDDASMQAIRAWLKAHPEEAPALMQLNRRYIFFREIEGDGPIGAEGLTLTPGRSLAVDTALLPLGTPVWLDTHWPATPERALRRLMVAQDTGAAIRGAVRGDVFWGTGEAALEQAGRMKSVGRYWLLLPRSVAARIKPAS